MRVLGRVLVATVALGCSVAAVDWVRTLSGMFSMDADWPMEIALQIGPFVFLVATLGLAVSVAAVSIALVAWRGTGPRLFRVWWLPFELIAQDDNLAVLAGSGFALVVAGYVF